MWEALYASQLIALEFFFRGFIVNGLRKSIGYAAVFVPIMPYTMSHFGKPLPEAIGSVITGFVLGTMALKTRSIWGGAAIHASVACGMDFLSLWQQGKLFSTHEHERGSRRRPRPETASSARAAFSPRCAARSGAPRGPGR